MASNVNNSLVKQDNRPAPFSMYINNDATKRWINSMLGGDTAQSQRFMTAVISAVSNNRDLATCEHKTIIAAALAGEALKLSPAPQMGQYYMVPFKDTKAEITKATFVLGYKGYIQLAIRSGYYKHINVIAVKSGELISFNPLTEEIDLNIIQDDTLREATPTIGYCATFEYLNGFRKTLYWSKEKMLAHADKYSPAFNVNESSFTIKKTGKKITKASFADFEAGNVKKGDEWLFSSFWYKDFDGMAFKTMLRQLISKWGIMSIELQQAYAVDGAFVNEKLEPEYVTDENIIDQEPEPAEEESAPPVEPETKDDPFDVDAWPEPESAEYEEMSKQADLEAEMQSAI